MSVSLRVFVSLCVVVCLFSLSMSMIRSVSVCVFLAATRKRMCVCVDYASAFMWICSVSEQGLQVVFRLMC